MMRRIRATTQKGQALSEMAMLLPVVVGLFALTLQGGLVIDDQVNIQHAAYEGAQWAVGNRTTASASAVQNHIYEQLCGLDSSGTLKATGSSDALTRYCRDTSLTVTVSTTAATAQKPAARDPLFGPFVVNAMATTCQQWDLNVTTSPSGTPINLSTGQSATITVAMVGPNGAPNPTGSGSAPVVAVSAGPLPSGLSNGTPFMNPPTISTGNTSRITITPGNHTSPGTYDVMIGGSDQCGNDPTSSTPQKDVKIVISGGSGPATPGFANIGLHGLLPLCVPIGGALTINGQGLSGATITVGGQPAQIISTGDNQIVVTVPTIVLPSGQSSTKVSITATTANGSSSLANAVTVGTCASTPSPPAADAATPCFLGGGGGATEYTIQIQWSETLVIPWLTNSLQLTANQRAFCQ
jgi:hypothetical protein